VSKNWGEIVKKIQSVPVSWNEVRAIWLGYKAWSAVLQAIPWVRGANMPEGLSEAIVCLCTKGELVRSGHGDVLLPDKSIAEVKATSMASSKEDVSSFSPTSKFSNLYFVERVDGTDSEFYVYDLHINRSGVEKLKITATQTFKSQADQGRRPRFSIRKLIIAANNLTPTWSVDLNTAIVRRLP
jgi:hypothetical protein